MVDALTAGLALASLRVMLLVPYERRIPLAGLFVSRLVAPVAGYRRRIRQNLALALPDLAPEEVSRLVRAVPDNVGRTIAEIWSGREFVARVGALPIEGPGVPTLEAARAEGRPVILAGGHIGNYDAARAALISQGFPMGGLYKPMTNRAFNGPYVRAIEAVGKPLFPRGKAGMTEMVRFLRAGGMLGLLTDQSMRRGRVFTFFGQPALTATSAADLALRYDAPLLTFYGLRQPDGLSFRIIVGGPIPRSDARSMTQALNDDLERVARDHLDQWFWIHRRWKAAGSRRDGGAT
ncbi:MAG: lauroyl acyltransferase [Rhodobacteraceae bacterium]|nr:lauroyl acyltransferase [Paracoccaceae bacterium]